MDCIYVARSKILMRDCLSICVTSYIWYKIYVISYLYIKFNMLNKVNVRTIAMRGIILNNRQLQNAVLRKQHMCS